MGRGSDGWQTTLADRVEITGVGVHSGSAASMTLLPARADTGICFVRSDLDLNGDEVIPANHQYTATTELATVIGDPAIAAVSTTEHLMAALHGLGIDNAIIEIDGPEVPILDGSAAPYVEAIRSVGVEPLSRPRAYIKVLRPVRVDNGAQFGELLPYDGFQVDIDISFACDVIGHQRVCMDVTPDVFARDLAGARTFGFIRDVERLWAAGYALGASLDNTVVVMDEGVMNPEGLRWPDEFVRHKALDAVGDLALAAYPMLGRYRSSRGGHKLNAQVLAALFDDAANYAIVEARPVRQHRIRASAGPALGGFAIAPAYGPDR